MTSHGVKALAGPRMGTPQARLCLVLAAVHAARLGAIRALQLDDVDLASRRLHLAGADRTMGELTGKVLREWLEYRQRRWPHTANPHLLVSKESALCHGSVSTAYLISLRGLPATLERLRIDCQLAEAMAHRVRPAAPGRGLRRQRAHRDPLTPSTPGNCPGSRIRRTRGPAASIQAPTDTTLTPN